MHKALLNDPYHWYHREEEARAIAEAFRDPAAREAMTRVADDYHKLAEAAANRLLTLPPNYLRGANLKVVGE